MHDSLLRKPIFIIQVQNFINKSQRNDIVCSLHMRIDLHWHNKLGKSRGGGGVIIRDNNDQIFYIQESGILMIMIFG